MAEEPGGPWGNRDGQIFHRVADRFPSPGACMDVLDFALYRAMFPGGLGRFWFARSVIEPRISARQIGQRIGVSEVSVRYRLAKMRERRFLQGYEVWPNPAVFGASIRLVEILAKDAPDADRILRQLPRVDGVISARVMIDEDGRHIRVSLIDLGTDATETRVREVVALASDPPSSIASIPEWIPSCPRDLRPLDWRMIGELRTRPELDPVALARRLGISRKTAARRLNELLDSSAIFWMLRADSSLLPVAAFFIGLRQPEDQPAVFREIEEKIVHWLPIAPGGLGEPPSAPPRWIGAMFWIPSPAATEPLTQQLLAIPGVAWAQRRYPGASISLPGWLDRQLAVRLGQAEGRPSVGDSGVEVATPNE